MALQAQPRRLALDLDAIASNQAVFEEAEAMAAEEGLPPGWLNGAAPPWLPPRPPETLTERSAPGLDAHLAPPEHLLAMKIIAFRDRDVADIKDLARALRLDDASTEDLRDLVDAVYATAEALATANDGPDERAQRRPLVASDGPDARTQLDGSSDSSPTMRHSSDPHV